MMTASAVGMIASLNMGDRRGDGGFGNDSGQSGGCGGGSGGDGAKVWTITGDHWRTALTQWMRLPTTNNIIAVSRNVHKVGHQRFSLNKDGGTVAARNAVIRSDPQHRIDS